MALRAVPDHPKFAELGARLSLPKYAALGLLESIWHFTGRFAPQGNIGKYSDQAIESWIGWDRDPGAVIPALTESRWMDADAAHRMLVHDWPQHADAMVHTTLARDLKCFADGTVPECGRLNQRERERFHAWLEREGIAARPQGRPSEKQPKSSHNAAGKQPNSAKKPKPEPVPEPEPVPVPETKTNTPAGAKRPPDPRALEFKNAFLDAFKTTNGIDAPWDAKEATNLARFLRANPSITLEQWNHVLYHRSLSPINQKASLSTWVGRALAWLDATADEWGKPLHGKDGNGYRNRGQARTESNLNNARAAAQRMAAKATDGIG